MSEPYNVENGEIAIAVLTRAHEELVAHGLGEVEACHALVHAGLDWLSDYCCPVHLHDEYTAVLEAADQRLEWLEQGCAN
jgi:hypothetical protein